MTKEPLKRRTLRKQCSIKVWKTDEPRNADLYGSFKNRTKAEEHLRRCGWKVNEPHPFWWCLDGKEFTLLAEIKEMLPQNQLPIRRNT